MKQTTLFFATAVLSLGIVRLAKAEHVHGLQCGHAASIWASIDSPSQRYAPDRAVDIQHFDLDVTPDFNNRRVTGTATFTFQPILKPLGQLRLDAHDLEIHAVTGSADIAAWRNTDRALIVTFAKPIAPTTQAKLTVTYEAEPKKGLYFRTPEMGYDPGDTHIWTQGESIEARHWFPCFDAPNEFFTSTMTCRVPKEMVVLSNGRKVSDAVDEETKLRVVKWSQDKPHVNYLITLVAGHFKRLEDKHGDLSMSFWTAPSDFANAANSFRYTKECMEYFEKEIGVPYPWAKYDQVTVQDFHWGGMENTSISTLNASTLFSSETENIRSSQGLMAHELAHQWFGDLVTCKDWSQLWLNEGFATYYTHLFAGHKDGIDEMRYGLYRDRKSLTSRNGDNTAMVNRKYDTPMEMFRKYGFLSYGKGSWVLHMLRSQLGPELFRKCVKTYLERHRHGNVVTEDLRSIIEEHSGRSFDRFFDQYVFHAHHPELKISYAWDEKTKLAKLGIKQEQKVDTNVLLFHVRLPVRFTVDGQALDRSVHVTQAEEDFYFRLAKAPSIVRIDPGVTLLARLSFTPPTALLHAQLADETDALGRLQAVEMLAKRKDKTTLEKLKHALQNDTFYAVRIAASKALRGIGGDDALAALIDSTDQPNAKVRQQVISSIASQYKPAALAALKQSVANEKNPAIRARAIGGLTGHNDKQARKLIDAALGSDTFRHQLADAAVSALRKQDRPANIAKIRDAMENDGAKFTTRGYAGALGALGHLGRNQKNKAKLREFLVGHVNSPKRRVALGAIDALGQLGDPRAISVLEKLTGAAEDDPARKAAEQAIEKLRAARKPADDYKNLRKEVTNLKQANSKLTKELGDLKKRFDATLGDKKRSEK
ncbi:MAG: M1 family metallopeptidase [Verrucomicrobiota bacterium]|jgi:aminopeptidase N|nr:M1 family metallopeptidase [Verrucomicrobiota bacterium]